MINNIYEHIRKASIEAQKQMIKANIIIIDTDLAKTNHLFIPGTSFFPKSETSYMFSPMIMGLEVKYADNLTRDYGFNFVITKGKTTLEELIELREENKELKNKLRKIKEAFGDE